MNKGELQNEVQSHWAEISLLRPQRLVDLMLHILGTSRKLWI